MSATTPFQQHGRSAGACLGMAFLVMAAASWPSTADARPPAQGGYGTIKGRLVWGGAEAPAPKQLYAAGDPKAKDPQVCAVKPILSRDLIVDPKTKGIANAFAFIPKPAGSNPEALKALVAKHPEVEIDQKNCEFEPYATVMVKDQTLVFKSSDPVNHNVRYFGFVNPAFNKILPPKGEDKVQLVAERRPLGLACDIHPWMKGYILVLDHPFSAVTKEDGSFEIQGVPPGAQRIVVWQASTGYVTPNAAQGIEIMVKPGEVTDVGEIKLDPAKVK